MPAAVKAWKFGDSAAPSFPKDFEIVKKVVLQVTDLTNNNNKYYALELHKGKGNKYRLYTHYGRTDDLEANPDAGQKECRYFDSLPEAQAFYDQIYREKTSARKGYREVALASSKIGSQKARGTSTGHMDDRTLEKLAAKAAGGGKAKPAKASTLRPEVQELVRYIYDEATNALTTTVAATITARGIETPLGILTVGQIEKGEAILADLYDQFKKKKRDAEAMSRLSSDFYTAIPHRIGRSRAAVQEAVISTLADFQQKQETLQLMKDMLEVNGDGGVLFNHKVDQEYGALGCEIDWVPPSESEYKEMADYVVRSQVKTKKLKVKNLWKLKRPGEWDTFTSGISNQRHLFHGSRISNWVGILSRGILLPKIVVSMGVDRTDEGWLGSGIYFGDAVCTSYFYCTPGKRKTSLIALARVALGKPKQYHKITYGLKAPPKGFDSCHGVRDTEFDDDEFVIYDGKQQRLEYLVEVTG